MCYRCRFKLPHEDHGDPRNIIEQGFLDVGKSKEIKNAGRPTAKGTCSNSFRKRSGAES